MTTRSIRLGEICIDLVEACIILGYGSGGSPSSRPGRAELVGHEVGARARAAVDRAHELY